ncbi:MAG: indolepyruvate ferredoxin oxidoreductase family protein, partial [Hydrogenophaga sp.]|nr:indolepyruvate ferredoxin oxidoreductase family protein [Hydrogenophaga sp.]
DVMAARMAKVFGHDALPESVRGWIERHAVGAALVKADPSLQQRLPYFCSGCPHNTSTQVPEGSRALAGIGCHYMSMWMDRRTETFSQMGGEGVPWIGQAPYTDTPHVFANLGDGTYMHSGSLAIRASVAAGVNITYKLLVNDAVAMTGGQPVEGAPSVPQLLRQLAAEGVKELHLVSDEPEDFQALDDFPKSVKVSHRDTIDALQRQLREVKGVSVIVYAQTCAAEKRRRRKKKTLVDPARRVVINEAVCEGCGDCGVQSNCVSILPLETPLGRKREIDQSGCNKDFSCVRGFCPSFVVLEGAQLRKPQRDRAAPPEGLPPPTLPQLDRPWNILVAGVGGTGVVTIGALMGMAAHLEGKGVLVLDMAGLAQKGGAVMSHVRLAADPAQLHAARVARGQADVVLGCDLMVGAAGDALASMASGRTHAVMNTDVAPTGSFTREPDWQASPEAMLDRVRAAAGEVASFEASKLAVALMGDAVATNVFLLGFAWQKGWVPLQAASLLRAIELNGAAVGMNRAAFAWGRQAALDLDMVRRAAGLPSGETVMLMPPKSVSLVSLLSDRVKRLTDYQSVSYARRYEDFVRRVADVEKARVGGDRLAREVAVSLYKLMAYKDEYEVARLHADSGFRARLQERFEGNFKLSYYLAPPLFARRDAQGRPVKQRYGAWVQTAFGLLARLRFLRGTAFDPFGWTQERREERAAVREFETLVDGLLEGLGSHNLIEAVEIARLPQQVRGYGHVKAREHEAMLKKLPELLIRWRSKTSLPQG